jgi:hypothetical protein
MSDKKQQEKKSLTNRSVFMEKYIEREGVVCIGWQRYVDELLGMGALIPFGYISGYKEAADELTDKAVECGLEDLYVFPIMFLYRHYLELLLKNMYFKYSKDSIEEKKVFVKKNGHKLSSYWTKCRKLLYMGGISLEDIDKIGDLVNDFERIDEHSFTFRYYLDKNLDMTLPKGLSVDLKKLKESIDKVDDLLYGTYG